jgi:hypothetical protein
MLACLDTLHYMFANSPLLTFAWTQPSLELNLRLNSTFAWTQPSLELNLRLNSTTSSRVSKILVLLLNIKSTHTVVHEAMPSAHTCCLTDANLVPQPPATHTCLVSQLLLTTRVYVSQSSGEPRTGASRGFAQGCMPVCQQSRIGCHCSRNGCRWHALFHTEESDGLTKGRAVGTFWANGRHTSHWLWHEAIRLNGRISSVLFKPCSGYRSLSWIEMNLFARVQKRWPKITEKCVRKGGTKNNRAHPQKRRHDFRWQQRVILL